MPVFRVSRCDGFTGSLKAFRTDSALIIASAAIGRIPSAVFDAHVSAIGHACPFDACTILTNETVAAAMAAVPAVIDVVAGIDFFFAAISIAGFLNTAVCFADFAITAAVTACSTVIEGAHLGINPIAFGSTHANFAFGIFTNLSVRADICTAAAMFGIARDIVGRTIADHGADALVLSAADFQTSLTFFTGFFVAAAIQKAVFLTEGAIVGRGEVVFWRAGLRNACSLGACSGFPAFQRFAAIAVITAHRLGILFAFAFVDMESFLTGCRNTATIAASYFTAVLDFGRGACLAAFSAMVDIDLIIDAVVLAYLQGIITGQLTAAIGANLLAGASTASDAAAGFGIIDAVHGLIIEMVSRLTFGGDAFSVGAGAV